MEKLNKPFFIEVSSVGEMNDKLSEGYEYVTVVYKEYQTSNHVQLSGNFMNNPISIQGNMGAAATNRSPYYLMRLTQTGNLLYGQS